jgi:hypothetical protein
MLWRNAEPIKELLGATESEHSFNLSARNIREYQSMTHKYVGSHANISFGCFPHQDDAP